MTDEVQHSLSSELQQLQEQVRDLVRELEQARSERQAELTARKEAQARWEEEREKLILNLLREMGQNRPFIPNLLEVLEDPETHLTSRDVLLELKRWIRDVSRKRVQRFPTEEEAPNGYITLTADELIDPEQGFDVGGERPFADGQDQVTFRVVRQGWRLGEDILHPARLTAFGVESDAEDEEKSDER
jgi:hypothetical protein